MLYLLSIDIIYGSIINKFDNGVSGVNGLTATGEKGEEEGT